MVRFLKTIFALVRRRWFVVTLLSLALLAVWALIVEPARLVRRPLRYEWSQQQGPLRVVFFSDLHQGSGPIDEAYVAKLVSRINAEKPDLVLIGGDLLINEITFGEWVSSEIVASELALLRSRLGTYAVLGNHDWWNDGPLVRESLSAAGIRVLENEALQLGDEGARFNLVGVGDDHTHHASIEKAFATASASLPTLAFMHDASALLGDPNVRFTLALAGHSHGGQVSIPLYGAVLQAGRAPLAWAYGDVPLPQGLLRVSGGIGTSIFPMRFNMPPEYLVIDFAPAR
jgi:uncharacterized protein